MAEKVQVVVIGGGATGSGILRDLALRGIECMLIEKNDLATGTSGRFHGLLHSGARYVVKDLSSAKECIEENKILKRIAPHCIENTGGLFVATKNDDLSYIPKWLEGCEASTIKVEELSPLDLKNEEPLLNPNIVKAYSVPDAAIDGFSISYSNKKSAEKKGAKVKTYTEVIGFKIINKKVEGVYIRDKATGREDLIKCDYVVNATGSWAGQIAKMAEENINISPNKGILVIFNHRITKRVVNHLRPPGNGDIFVPHGSVTVLGTTSKDTSNPEDNEANLDEVLGLINEGSILIPDIKDMRIVRAFAGVRPLYQPDGNLSGRSATREFSLINHEELSGLQGFVSVVGGKFTTFRLMAEKTVDFIAKKLGVDKACTTHEEILPPIFTDDDRIAKEYMCQCEMVTKKMLDKAVVGKETFTLSDVRRITRLGMGPCQGTFCTYRASGYYHVSKNLDPAFSNKLLKDHLEERFKGNKPVLWGEQAKEMQLTRGIYLSLLNLERLECDSNEV